MTHIIWNWLLKNWPQFTYDKVSLTELEQLFLENSGTVVGALKHITNDSKDDLLVEILSNEAIKTSEIEGEFLNRDSVRKSISKKFFLEMQKYNIIS